MVPQDFRTFTELLKRWARAYYPHQKDTLDWELMPEGYFEDLVVLTFDELKQVLTLARQRDKWWPSSAWLRELGHVAAREDAIRAHRARRRTIALPPLHEAGDAQTLQQVRARLAEIWPEWRDWNRLDADDDPLQ